MDGFLGEFASQGRELSLHGVDGVFNQHGELTIGPCVEAPLHSPSNISGAFDVRRALEDDGDEDKGALGVPFSVDDASKFLGEGGEESFPKVS